MQAGVLGPLVVSAESGEIELGGPRQRRLMAALLLHRGQVVSTDTLAEVVFEGEPTDRASTTLRSYVARLRKSLSNGDLRGDELVVTESPGYALRWPADGLDTERFAHDVERGRHELRDGDVSSAVTTLRRALEWWRGRAYEEFVYEDWARTEVERLEEERLVAEELLAEAMLACGLADEVVPAMRKMGAEHPLRERPRAHLMLALYRAGRQAEALRAFQDHRRTLADVALEPSGELVALDRSIVAQDPALLLPAPAGRALRGYRLGARLGEGRHGVVYRGVQPGLGRDVAVKTIRSELADDPSFVRRFDAEARVVSRLEHPHIVPLYDFWREPGGAFMVMRLLAGDLSARVDEGPLPVAHAGQLLSQVGSALMTAHRSGVVHGNLRATNVLLDEGGNAYLSDFGLSFLVSGGPPSGGESSGYEAPEQRRGEAVTTATDQFGLAVLAVHVLTGHLPFGAFGISGDGDRPASVHLQRSGVPVGVDSVLQRALAWDPDDRYPELGDFLDDVLRALEGSERTPQVIPARNPYLGLRAFDEGDVDVFFGRDGLIGEVVATLDSNPCATLVGASGSGKSSVVRAGVVPRLRRSDEAGDGRLVVTMTPGDDPFGRLAVALREVALDPDHPPRVVERSSDGVRLMVESATRDGDRVVLILDQLEELFTLTTDETIRDEFVAGLVSLTWMGSREVRILATLRADFFDRPLRYHDFGRLVSDGAVAVVGLSAEELDAAIRGPAGTVGVEVEPALAGALVADVLDQPAALPLLQFTLTELFEVRSGPTMTLDAHRGMGGVDGAVARRADDVYEAFDEQDRGRARRLFTSLVTIDPDGTATRRRVRRADLEVPSSDPTAMRRVIDAFGDARLLAFDRDRTTREPTVDVAHESLVTSWPRFAMWVHDEESSIRLHAQLREAALSWDADGRDGAHLYRGGRLDAATEWAAKNDETLTTTERAFVDASIARREQELAADRTRLEKERRTSRRLRRQLVAVAVVMMLAIAAGVVAVNQRNEAQESADRADAEAARALAESERAIEQEGAALEAADTAARERRRAELSADEAERQRDRNDATLQDLRTVQLASAAAAVADEDTQLALILALDAARFRTEETETVATNALLRALSENREIFHTPNGGNGMAHFSPDGELFVTLAKDPAYLAVRSTSQPGDLVARLGPSEGSGPGDAVFSPDGTSIVTTQMSSESSVDMYEVETGELLWSDQSPPSRTMIPAFSNDGSMVAGGSGVIGLWDAETGDLVRTLDPPTDGFGANLAFSPDDELLAVTYWVAEGIGLVVYDTATGEALWTTDLGASDVAFSPEGTLYSSSRRHPVIRIWNPRNGELLDTFDDHRGTVTDLHVSADGRFVASGGSSDVLVWETRTHEVVHDLRGHAGEVDAIDITANGDLVVTAASQDATTRLWDTSEPQTRRRGPTPTTLAAGERPVGAIVYSPRGDRLVTSGPNGSLDVWESGNLRRLDTFTGLGSIFDAEFTSDGSSVVIASTEGATQIDLDSGARTSLYDTGTAIDVDVADETVLVAVHHGGSHLIDMSTGAAEQLVATHSTVVALDPEGGGAILAWSGSEEDTARMDMFDIGSGEIEVELPVGVGVLASRGGDYLHVFLPKAVEYHESTRRFVSGGQEGNVVVWDADSGESLSVLKGHTSSVLDVAFNPTDPHQVLSGSADGTVRLWDVESGVDEIIIDVGVAVSRVAFHPDGGEIAIVTPTSEIAGTGNGFVETYDVDFDTLFARAESQRIRAPTEGECARVFELSTGCWLGRSGDWGLGGPWNPVGAGAGGDPFAQEDPTD